MSCLKSVATLPIRINFPKDFTQFEKIKMSQNRNNEGETVDTSVEIPMSIDSLVKRNCGFMKKWSDNDIAGMFRSDGNLRSIYPAHILPRINLVKRTRELAVFSLLMLFEENIPSSVRLPTKTECTKLANEIISEENIRHKFYKTIIISVGLRPYNPAEFNNRPVYLDVEFEKDFTHPF